MKLSDVSAVLSEAIYKENPSSLRIQGIRWMFVRTLSKLPTLGVWVNVPLKIVIIAVRGTTNLYDLGQDIYIFNNAVEKTTNYRTAMDVLNEVRKEYKGYQIVITGHSYGGSVAVKIGKENPDIKAFGFNTGVGYKAIPEILKDKALCNIFRFKKRCHDNVQQYTTRNGIDPISVLSRLDSAKGRTRTQSGFNTHSVSNLTGNIEKEEIKPLERQAENKPLDPVDPVGQTEQQTESVDSQQGGKVMLNRHFNTTKMADNYMNGMYDRLFRNEIVIK